MYSILKPTRAAVFYNSKKWTCEKVKQRTGASHVMNAWVFDSFTRLGNWTIVDNKILSRDQYSDYCFVSDYFGAPVMSTKKMMPYVISAVPILKDGQRLYRDMTKDVARKAERTAIGWRKDGEVLLWCDKQQMVREQLQDKLLELGCVDALMFDGGGSTQCRFPNGSVTSSRLVPTYILLWDSANHCPYKFSKNVRLLSVGESAKAVQYQLNRHGDNLDIDGIFGSKSAEALKRFQRAVGLDADGICGPKTWDKLIK